MDIQYLGGNCLKVATKEATIIIDDNLAELGLKSVLAKADIVLNTHKIEGQQLKDEQFLIDGPGEYEIHHVSVRGVPARAHMDEKDTHAATMYKLSYRGLNAAILGHIYPELSDEQLERLGMVDVLVVPIGGNGYTLDAQGAVSMIRKIEPKIVIPTHYKVTGVKYEVPQNELKDFVQELGAPVEKQDRLKIKVGATLPESLAIIELTKA